MSWMKGLLDHRNQMPCSHVLPSMSEPQESNAVLTCAAIHVQTTIIATCRVNVVAFDFLGHGESPHINDGSLYTADEVRKCLCHCVYLCRVRLVYIMLSQQYLKWP